MANSRNVSQKATGAERVPPQAQEVEQAVLGAMLLDREAIGKAIELLDESCFYGPAHQKMFSAIISLYDRGEPADLLTVTRKLEMQGNVELLGGVSYIDTLIDSTPTAVNTAYYAEQVKDEYTRRQLIRTAAKAYNRAFDATEAVEGLLSDTEQDFMDIRGGQLDNRVVSSKAGIKDLFRHLVKIAKQDSSIVGIPTGFTDLDEALCGLQTDDRLSLPPLWIAPESDRKRSHHGWGIKRTSRAILAGP